MDGYHLGRMDCFMAELDKAEIVDLSHVIEDGHDHLQRPARAPDVRYLHACRSPANYDAGPSFRSAGSRWSPTPDLCHSPFHRYADGKDLSELPLAPLADLPGMVVRRRLARSAKTGAPRGLDVRGKAVLIHTGWDRHWRTVG